jgi:hypothetical protein
MMRSGRCRFTAQSRLGATRFEPQIRFSQMNLRGLLKHDDPIFVGGWPCSWLQSPHTPGAIEREFDMNNILDSCQPVRRSRIARAGPSTRSRKREHSAQPSYLRSEGSLGVIEKRAPPPHEGIHTRREPQPSAVRARLPSPGCARRVRPPWSDSGELSNRRRPIPPKALWMVRELAPPLGKSSGAD